MVEIRWIYNKGTKENHQTLVDTQWKKGVQCGRVLNDLIMWGKSVK